MSAEEILDALPDGVVVVEAGCVAYMNRMAERLTARSRSESLGRPYGEVVPLVDSAGFLLHECCDPFAQRGGVASGMAERDFVVRRGDGTERAVVVRASYERDGSGRVRRMVMTLRDAARRRRLERAGSELISVVAHEIRSPLTSVKGFTSTLLHRWERFTDEQKQHMLRTVNADADRVTRLLDDLLNVSRLEAGRLQLRRQEIDLSRIAAAVAERLSLESDRHRITVRFPAPFPRVVADPGKVEQVLVNLVENALRHGDPGEVTVAGEARDREVVVRVADQGPGIPREHAPHIFTKFYRRGAGERHAGTGLGLFICKGIVEAHGGRIELERSGGEGSTFAFTLPVAQDQ